MHKFIFRVICAEIYRPKALRAMAAGCPGAPGSGGERPGCAPTRALGPRQWLCRNPAARSAGFQDSGAGGNPSFLQQVHSGGGGTTRGALFFFFFFPGERAQASRGKAPSRNVPKRQRSRTRSIWKQRTRLLRTASSLGTLRSLTAAPPPSGHPRRVTTGRGHTRPRLPGCPPGPAGAPRRAQLPSTVGSRSRCGGISEQMWFLAAA